jgi:hypothetical protein
VPPVLLTVRLQFFPKLLKALAVLVKALAARERAGVLPVQVS